MRIELLEQIRQRGRQLGRGTEAVLGPLGHRLQDDLVERLGDVAQLGPQRGHRIVDVGEDLRDLARPLVRDVAGHRLKQHAAEGVDVRAGVAATSLDPLGAE